jgi:antitoxin (DNA-binding transcriptional repressor) of toxin-antitoxin stability system
MDRKPITHRQFRNQIDRVLREAEAGQSFAITVRGRAIAALDPLSTERRVDADAETVARILATPIDSDDLAAELDAAEAPVT